MVWGGFACPEPDLRKQDLHATLLLAPAELSAPGSDTSSPPGGSVSASGRDDFAKFEQAAMVLFSFC